MAIAVDANTTNNAGTGSASFNHTATSSTTNPVKGVVVMFIGYGIDATEISSCSYASNAMTQITTTGFNGTNDDGFVDMYYIGDQYTPGGTQTISFTRSGTTADVNVAVFSLTGTGALQFQSGSVSTLSAVQTNPSVTTSVSSANCLSFLAYMSGLNAPGSITDGSGFTRYDGFDFGNGAGITAVQDTQSTSDFTFSFTAGSDEAVLAAFAVKEVPIQIYTYAGGQWYPATLSVYPDGQSAWYSAHPYVYLNGRWIS